MVTFAGVGEYLSRTRLNNETKKYVREVFRQLRRGDLYIPGRPSETVRDLFKTQECRLWMSFMTTLTIETVPRTKTQFTDWSGDGLGLGPLYILLKEFMKYEDQILPDEAMVELPVEPGTAVTAAFLVCNDHEGIMPIAMMTPNVTPEAGVYVLHQALHQRLLGGR